jgi:hypothetical protein
MVLMLLVATFIKVGNPHFFNCGVRLIETNPPKLVYICISRKYSQSIDRFYIADRSQIPVWSKDSRAGG